MVSIVEHLVTAYGGVAIALGAGLEGEAAVTAGGFLAHRGLIDPIVAALCAFAGSFLADQLILFGGRHQRARPYVQRARSSAAAARALRFVERYPVGFCLAFRFIYGLRIAGPLAIGFRESRSGGSSSLNAASAFLWASVFTFIGFRFGGGFEAVARTLVSTDQGIGALIVVVVAILGGWTAWHFRQRSDESTVYGSMLLPRCDNTEARAEHRV